MTSYHSSYPSSEAAHWIVHTRTVVTGIIVKIRKVDYRWREYCGEQYKEDVKNVEFDIWKRENLASLSLLVKLLSIIIELYVHVAQ